MATKPLPHELCLGEHGVALVGLVPAMKPCRSCGEARGAFTSPRPPQPDDISLCWHCGNPSILGPNLEELELDLDSLSPEMREAVVAAQAVLHKQHADS